MKKSLLNKVAAAAIIIRVAKLSPDSNNKWGKMTATEMLMHCNLCNLQILEEEGVKTKSTFKQQLLKILSLYIVPDFPKNLQSSERNHTNGKCPDSLFFSELNRFNTNINLFPNHDKPMTLAHPAFGSLSNNQWGIAAWKHMDHHLRQFGV